MYEQVEIRQFRDTQQGTDLLVTIPDKRLGNLICNKRVRKAELRFDDGRHISAEQRKKAYATIRDIADYTGYLPEEMKEIMKYEHMIRTGDGYFSLSDCSMGMAREFINTLLEFALENGIPLSDNALERTDDIGRYLYFCIMHKNVRSAGGMGRSIMKMPSGWEMTGGRWMIPCTKRFVSAESIIRLPTRWALSDSGKCTRSSGS